MPERPARIVLVGFMGAGKSAVGRRLARRLKYRFVDLDLRIEKRAGKTIAELFREQGEAAFRALEREEAGAVSELENVVVAAGGGAFVVPATRELLRKGALTVWLQCDLEIDSAASPRRRKPPACREP